MVTYLFSVHTITEAKQSNRQGGARVGARAVDLPARSFDVARPGVAPPLYTTQCYSATDCRFDMSVNVVVVIILCRVSSIRLLCCLFNASQSSHVYN